ncbi:hypothetical protein BH10ACI1_BH10ACI1_10890 [soil metagenome]
MFESVIRILHDNPLQVIAFFYERRVLCGLQEVSLFVRIKEIVSISASINHLDSFAIEAVLLSNQGRLQLHRDPAF